MKRGDAIYELVCRTCGKWFVGDYQTLKYCCEKCRWIGYSFHKSRSKARRREALRLTGAIR